MAAFVTLEEGARMLAGSGAWTIACCACLLSALARPGGAQVPTYPAYTYIEAGGVVSAEAEHYTRRTSGTFGKKWAVIPVESMGAGPPIRNARGGKYVQILGGTTGGGAPAIEYDLNIATAGRYRLYVRWDGTGGDSVFVKVLQLKDGTGGAIADWYELHQNLNGDFATPGWDGMGGFEQNTAVPTDEPTTWDIPSAGSYTLQFLVREDGAAIDSFVFQLAELAPPGGLGPPVSAADIQPMPIQPVDAVEFHHAALDHYFISADPVEVAALRAGAHAGWKPTGHVAKVYDVPGGDLGPVCRFYIPPASGDSHFYSASPEECDQVRAKFPHFVHESSNVMFAALPDPASGMCAQGLTPLFRLWNTRIDSNHRYTTDAAVRHAMLSRGYVPEGYGSLGVAMCGGPEPEGIHGWQFEHERDWANARLPYHYNIVQWPEHPVRFGTSSQRFEERRGDCYTTDCTRTDGVAERNEVTQVGYQNHEGEEYWYGLSFFVAADLAAADPYVCYFQFHNSAAPGEPFPSGVPLQFVKEPGGGFSIYSFPGDGSVRELADSVIPARDFYGRWHDVVMHIRWSTQADGYLRMWVNGVQRVDHRGATMPTTYRIGHLYFKYGIYGGTTSAVRVAYFDELRRGRSREEVDIRLIEATTGSQLR